MADNLLTIDVKVLPDVVPGLTDQASRIINQVGNGIVAEMKRIMALPKTGRTYRKKGGVLHVASAPGQPPAMDTGNLTNSISMQMIGPLQGRVNINAEYAAYLEYGTVRMAARPYLQPAIDQTRQDFLAAGILRSAR